MIKVHKISHDYLTWEAHVAIDEEKAAPAIKEMVEFWMGWEQKLAVWDGNYTHVFLLMLGRNLLSLQIEWGYDLAGIIEKLASQEGWLKLDGSHGIELMYVEDYNFEDDEFSVSPIRKS